ncbi:DUF2637 domain-containing protein [Actinacidiphila acididurans]|uniref:DUF2637 domain-containing protein n=1 Tax=Actinacidiphila acididurans TaxID=2784346 RepID=A0ABS2U0U5_9ACTN|nr:DUF2637 domain-containing protein [Actinacidiphila acididurans]MBM9509214.1 DUF2637 domain-containing protein [Actinacidiphila acididurans]
MKRRADATSTYVTGWDRAAVAALGAAGCALSYSALQQMAVAIHVRPALCWLFPLAVDGFISYGVRALVVLRTAPLRARLYIWALFGAATAVSVWANALHAVRLNQVTTTVTALRLGDQVVAALSTVAPLALAGAVHLYILIARGPDNRWPAGQSAHGVSGQPDGVPVGRTHRSGQFRGDRAGQRGRSALGQHPLGRLATAPLGHVAAATDAPTGRVRTPSGRTVPGADHQDRPQTTALPGRPDTPPVTHDRDRTAADPHREPDTDHLLTIAREAVQNQGKLTRKVVAQAIRGQNIPLSNDALTQLMAELRQQYGHTAGGSRN